MSQAKVLTEKEIKKVVKVIDSKRHATRNRCMFLLTHGSGMRVRNQLLGMCTGMSVMRWVATVILASCAMGLRTSMQSERSLKKCV